MSTQVRLLALLGSAAPLNVLLDGLATYVETWATGLRCTLQLVDATGRLLVPGAAPSLEPSYANDIGVVPIEDGRGCCGTAAARGELVVVDDIEHSPLWTGYAAIALSHGLRSCWSVPIFDDARSLLGTLALYCDQRRKPSPVERDLIEFAASLAAFVIQRHRDAQRIRTTEARIRAAVWGTEIGLWETTAAGDCQWFDGWCERFDIDPCIGRDGLRRWIERIHPDDLERYSIADVPCTQGRADHYAIEYRIRTGRGDWRWVHERGRVAARTADGTATHLVGVCIDIDEQKRLEAALRSAEDRYELAIDAARLPVWEYDVSGNIVTGNVHWHRALGVELTRDQARQCTETWLNDVHPDDCALHANIFAGDTADATGHYQTEFRMKMPDGGYKWLLDRGRVVERGDDGAPLRVVGISLDIDARRRAETGLRESEQRFRGAFEFAAIGMALVAPDGHFLRVNHSLCRIVGYTMDELLATNFQNITHPDDLDADLGYVRQMLDGALSHYDMEKRYFHKDGYVVWVLISVSMVRDEAGTPMYFVGQVQDITARKRAESQLFESELRYRTIADLVPGFVFEGVVRDGQPHPTWVSEGFKRVFGCTLGRFVELKGKGFYDAAGRAQILSGAAAVSGGSDVGFDVSLRSRDGSQKSLHVVARTVDDGAGGSSSRVVGVAEDITERKRLERALSEATHQEHQRLGQEIHDGLGQELTGLAYLASSLATGASHAGSPMSGDLTRLADVARHAIETCRNIARGVSPLTEGRGSLVVSLRRIAELAATSGAARVEFEAIENAPLTLPPESLDQLLRITQEAVNNAVKHSEAKAIDVTIEIDPTLVRIEIVDDGRGFAPRGASSEGVGLDSMRQRAAAIGAALRIRSKKSSGVSIVCECPQVPAAARRGKGRA